VKDTEPGLLTIGEFAALTRLAPSALRFYDDSGLLAAARVDPVNGYRHYSPRQVPTAVLIRELRALAMPIAEIRSLLGSGGRDAHRRLDDYWRSLEARMEAGRARLGSAHRLIDRLEEPMGTVITIEATTLRTAIRQVLPAAPTERARPGREGELPVGVLLQAAGGALRMVATDGHRLAMRELVPAAIAGGDAQRIVAAPALAALASTLGDPGAYELRLDELPEERGPFPPYEKVLGGLPRIHCLVSTVAALRQRLEAGDPVARLTDFEPPLTVGFNRDFLLTALDSAAGPDIIIETAGPHEPALLRSADDGGFTCIVMPIRLV
jgi:DNA-binding transcriptional MerR regulator